MLDGRLLGKPDDAAHARRMLKQLSGKCHEVLTGFTIMDSGSGKTVSRVIKTKVYFKELSSRQIEEYVETGEPLGKAGAYAIQGLGAAMVDKIEGDYFNVVGLPVRALARELKKFGIELPKLLNLTVPPILLQDGRLRSSLQVESTRICVYIKKLAA